MTNISVLQVDGNRIVNGSGEEVVLQGYNVGGWMNMENFLTGFPGTEAQHRASLRQSLGKEMYDAFFEQFMSGFFGEADVAFMASLGLNSIRIPFHHAHFQDSAVPFELKEQGFQLLDRALEACAKHKMWAVLDLHSLPGHQNQDWHSDNATHMASFWSHRDHQDRVVSLWEALADRYRGNPWVAGYNLMNEPADPSGGYDLRRFYDRTISAVREIDADHIIFLDGNRYGLDFEAFDASSVPANVVYSAHDYKTPGFIDGGPYPGVTDGEYVDRAEVERSFLKRTEFMRRTNTPIWIGEFGPVFTGDLDRDQDRYDLLADQLSIYKEHGAGWCLWAYKDIGGEGLVYADPNSPWMRRIKPVVDKKARLGVDHWGSLDTHIRHIVGPIEQLFDQEYPDFDPFPFGRRFWIHRLIRHIVIAEPMVAEFARLFEDVGDLETVHELAGSFAFENCVQRRELMGVLVAATGAGAAALEDTA